MGEIGSERHEHIHIIGGTMDFNKGVVTREAWGTKPCKHPMKESEYFMGKDTGKTVCTVCGKLFLSGVPVTP
jgi:hypothetical protein